MEAGITDTPISRAINLVGSQEAFAQRVGVSQQAVSKWLKKGSIPAEKVVLAEQAVEGAITRHEFRPDIFAKVGRQSRQSSSK